MHPMLKQQYQTKIHFRSIPLQLPKSITVQMGKILSYLITLQKEAKHR